MYNIPVFCINLEHRADRKKHSLEQFTKLGIQHDKVIYPNFTKDIRGGAYGCFDSHMKIWNNFFINYPNDNYAFVFEDDFVSPENGEIIIEQVKKYIEVNYNKIDIVFLHNICVKVENEINNEQFTNGYGFGTHVYIITRNYIQSIITKYGKLPEPNGRQIDFEIVSNSIDSDNKLYSNKIYYTNNESFTQLLNNESDNYVNIIDRLIRVDTNKSLDFQLGIIRFMKKYNLINDKYSKLFIYIIAKLTT